MTQHIPTKENHLPKHLGRYPWLIGHHQSYHLISTLGRSCQGTYKRRPAGRDLQFGTMTMELGRRGISSSKSQAPLKVGPDARNEKSCEILTDFHRFFRHSLTTFNWMFNGMAGIFVRFFQTQKKILDSKSLPIWQRSWWL